MNKRRTSKLIVKEKTPSAFYCTLVACPSVFETNRKTFIIVGKKINMQDITEEIKNKIGKDETCIEVPKELITKLIL